MKPTFLLILFAITLFSGYAQTKRQMVVCDAITLEAIPYTTVKVLHKEDGTYADEVGKFEVKASDKDSLMVSCVGYQSKTVVPQCDTILLKPVFINLDEVKVTTVKREEQIIGLGKSKKVEVLSFCGHINTEYVLKINTPESLLSYRIKGVLFNSKDRNGQSLLRLHIYNMNKDGLPDKEMLPQDVIINQYLKANGEIDLSRFGIILNENVLFVGIEEIQTSQKFNTHKGECIGIGFTLDRAESLTYIRTLRDPQYKWRLSNFKFGRLLSSQSKSLNPANLMVSLIID